MDRPQLHHPQLLRRLRLGSSVCFALIAVALCVLWPLTLTRDLSLGTPGSSYWDRTEIGVGHGSTWIANIKTTEIRAPWPAQSVTQSRKAKGLVWPIWLAIALSAGLAAALRKEKPEIRFSLRTLLIATTLLALALGLAMWAAK